MNPPAIRIFVSYSHRDEDAKDRLLTHLELMQRQGLIAPWNDRQILPAEEWEPAIMEHLEQADLILLLVSADFLASDFCWDRELKRAIERHDAGQAKVVPVFVRPCDWKGAPFGKIQGIPKDAVPIYRFADPELGFTDAAKAIRRLVEGLPPKGTTPGVKPFQAIVAGIGRTPARRRWRVVALIEVLLIVAVAGYWWWPRHLFDRGQTAYEEGDWDAAHWGLGLLAERDGHLDEALGYYRAAVAADDGDWRFALAAGALLERAGRAPEAIEILRPLVERDPGLLAAYPHLAAALRLTGGLEEAEYYQAEAARRVFYAATWTRERNRDYWIFLTGRGPVELRGTAAKRAWLAADHALTLFLLGREEEAQARLAAAEEGLARTPQVFAGNIRSLLAYQLARLSAARPAWTEGIEAFRVRFEVPAWAE